MKYRKHQKNSISSLMALLVFGIFAVCILAVLLLGADIYESLSARDQKAYGERTGVQYLASRVRQAECGEQIWLDRIGSSDALVIPEQIEGERYQTWVYCYDGWLREYFTEEGLEKPEPELGEEVLEAESLELTLEDGLLEAVFTVNGEKLELVIQLRGSKYAAEKAEVGL